MKTTKRTKKKLCDECGKKPSTTKLDVKGIIINDFVQGPCKMSLCDDCTSRSMKDLAKLIRDSAG